MLDTFSTSPGTNKITLEEWTMNEYLTFKKMITPIVIQVVFWLGMIAVIVGGIGAMFATQYGGGFFKGLMILVFGTLLWRIYCELVIVFFQMNDSMTEIRKNTAKQ
jgi:hypothetical protein